MKDNTFYFSHDYNVRSNSKIKKLIQKHGFQGYGIFWALIEDLYNNANALPMDCEGIAFDLRTDCETIQSIISDFGLFDVTDEIISSKGVEERLELRKTKSEKAKESALKRWKSKNNANALPTHSERIANAMQTDSERNAKKEIKGKEIKGKEIKGKEIKEKEIKKNIEELPLPFDSENFKSAWFLFVKHRKEKKKPLTENSAELIFEKLRIKTENIAIAMLKKAVESGWTSVYEINENEIKVSEINIRDNKPDNYGNNFGF